MAKKTITDTEERELTMEEILNSPVKRPVGRPPVKKKNTNMVRSTSFGQDYAEKGDNAKYLGHALATRNMPLVDLNDIDAVRERILWYFEHCFNNDMKPTVSGLCNALKIQRQTLLNWRQGQYREDSYQAVILDAYGLMEELWENYMQNGKINPVSGIFLAKNNFGYADRQDYVITPNTAAETVDVATIEAKYAELPEPEDN